MHCYECFERLQEGDKVVPVHFVSSMLDIDKEVEFIDVDNPEYIHLHHLINS